jgi:YbgC/YbaW family acyl-CoA thioester hydrolase
VAAALVLRRRVQFYETDAAGIVHFSNFFRYMEEAEHALWRENGISIFPAEPTHGWPRVAASFDYKKPLRFEDEFEIHLRVEHISTRSLRYACRIECRGDLVAEGGMTIVCVTRDADHTMRAAPIPEALVARFRPPSPQASAGKPASPEASADKPA